MWWFDALWFGPFFVYSSIVFLPKKYSDVWVSYRFVIRILFIVFLSLHTDLSTFAIDLVFPILPLAFDCFVSHYLMITYHHFTSPEWMISGSRVFLVFFFGLFYMFVVLFHPILYFTFCLISDCKPLAVCFKEKMDLCFTNLTSFLDRVIPCHQTPPVPVDLCPPK